MSRIFDPKVFQLGYVGLGCTDIEKTTAHYLNNPGLSETAKGHDRETYLSVGYEHHNVILKKTDQKSLLSLGCGARAWLQGRRCGPLAPSARRGDQPRGQQIAAVL
jgi:hypothetical protein